jgi:hypothetical protein
MTVTIPTIKTIQTNQIYPVKYAKYGAKRISPGRSQPSGFPTQIDFHSALLEFTPSSFQL